MRNLPTMNIALLLHPNFERRIDQGYGPMNFLYFHDTKMTNSMDGRNYLLSIPPEPHVAVAPTLAERIQETDISLTNNSLVCLSVDLIISLVLHLWQNPLNNSQRFDHAKSNCHCVKNETTNSRQNEQVAFRCHLIDCFNKNENKDRKIPLSRVTH